MYGATIQEEYLQYCRDRGHEPERRLVETHTAASFLKVAEECLGRPPSRTNDRMVLHYRAMTFDADLVTRRVTWSTDQQVAIREALAELPEPMREKFAGHIDRYMVDTIRAGSYLVDHDPALAMIESAAEGAVVTRSIHTILGDLRIDWHSALKYGRLVRCYGPAPHDLSHIYAWARTGRSVDATRLWNYLCEQAAWLGLADPPLQEFVETLKAAPSEPGTFDTWVAEELVPLVQFCTHNHQTKRIAKPLGDVVQWSHAMPPEVASGLYECGLEETKRLTTGLQRALATLPQLGDLLCKSLRSTQRDRRLAAAKWLRVCPNAQARKALEVAHRKETDPITRQRLAAAIAANSPRASVGSLDLRKVMDDCLDMAADRDLPNWFRSMAVPPVKWSKALKPTMGELVPRKVVLGLIAGTYRMRFQGKSAELELLRQCVDPYSWVELSDFVLYVWISVLCGSFDEANTKGNYVRNLFNTPLVGLPHKAKVMAGARSPFVDSLEAVGLLEFFSHACPTSSAVRLWCMMESTSWHYDLVADAIAEDILRTVGLRQDSAAASMMFDLDYVWHCGIREGSTSAGFAERAHELGISVPDLEWKALPDLGLDATGRGYFYDGNGWWPVLVDEYFQVLMAPETTASPSLVTAWRKSHGIVGLQELVTRASVRMYNLVRELAALDTPMDASVWSERFLQHPLLRKAASRTVWQVAKPTGVQWFTVRNNGVTCDLLGDAVSLDGGEIRVASCVNTPAGLIEHWKAWFERQNRYFFTDQFVFAGQPGAYLVEGYWRIDTSATQIDGGSQLLVSQCDEWAYVHGYVDESDAPGRVGVYCRYLQGQVAVRAEFETHQMPVPPNTKTAMVQSASYDLSDDAILAQPLVREAVRQQMYTDLLALYSGQSWAQPPGVRCL